MDKNEPQEQAAYRNRYSTSDHLHPVLQALEKTSKYQITLYMVFVDYESAFISIKHEAIFKAIEKHGVPIKIINIIKETYRGDTAQVRTDKISGKIKIQKGVRQGDTL